MHIRPFLPRGLPLLVQFALLLNTGAAQQEVISGAVEALERGDLVGAEDRLRAELREKPNDDAALGFLGVVLDQEKKYSQADDAYRRALALSPRSAGLLNNYGNHLLASGKPNEARAVFLRVLALDPGHANAAVQLARIALQHKAPAEAVNYLDRLPLSEMETPQVSILRMQADYELGRETDGDALLERLSRAAESDPHLNPSVGVALAAAGKYERAEMFFSRAADAAPADFQALYDLGLAASHAGHEERAREVLEKALALEPQNVDAMYDLAAVNAKLGQNETALQLLARAVQIAPQRTDALSLLAHTAADLGYFGDAAQAWEKYMKLVPNDDTARREHGFAETALGEDMKAALADLEWYVRKHPNDAVGHYELGTAEAPSDKDEALKQLDRALVLKPDLTAAHVARGLLYYRQGKLEAAVADFEFAAERDAKSATILDRLGQTYMAVNRTADAVQTLKKAAELAPRDSTILFHYARALSKAGQKEEASAVFARYRELGPANGPLPHPAGLIDFLGLSPEEQRERYREGVERTVQHDPSNVEAQVRYMQLLLEDGKTEEARAVSRNIAALRPSTALSGKAARALLAAEQYEAAKEFIERCGDSSGELRLDRAIADSHVASAQAGLDEMDQIPVAERNGDYYLALTAMLEEAGNTSEAAQALKQAEGDHPTRADLYHQAAALLIRNRRTHEAQELLDEATRALPEDAELSMMKHALEVSPR